MKKLHFLSLVGRTTGGPDSPSRALVSSRDRQITVHRSPNNDHYSWTLYVFGTFRTVKICRGFDFSREVVIEGVYCSRDVLVSVTVVGAEQITEDRGR